MPRRVFVASGLSAILAGGAVALGLLGQITAPMRATFQFSQGTALARGEVARLRAHLVLALEDERIAVVIIGHTGTEGDSAANQALSEARAQEGQAVAIALGVPATRIAAQGMAGAAPLAQEPGESDRAYQARLARVDVTLQVRR